MKKINSIDYGGKVMGIGAIFLLVIPAALYLLNKLIDSNTVNIMLYISMGIGAAIETGFFVLLAVELRQDRIIGRYYQSNPSSAKTPQQILDEHRMRKGK